MTTILADAKFGVMVSDAVWCDSERVGRKRKVFRVHGVLVGMAGSIEEFGIFLAWCKTSFNDKPPKFPHLNAMVLSPSGLLHFAGNGLPIKEDNGIQAIGTGAMAAMAAYEALGFTDPKAAVRIACHHDANSRGPVRVYRL